MTITVTGTNFAQGDTVEWVNLPLTSTFISSTQMTAIVPSALIDVPSTPTTASIIVQTPVPSSLNFGTTIAITAPPLPGSAGFTVSAVGVQANDLVWDPVSQQIYLSVAGTNPTNPNIITALNPVTGQFGASVSAGPGANHLAVSSDSSWLYAGIDSNNLVQRFTLPALTTDITIPLGSNSLQQPYYALDIEAAPGSANTIAVSLATSLERPGSVVIFDGSTPRPTTVAEVDGNPEALWSLAWNTNDATLYGAFNQAFPDPVAVMSVNSTGVQLVQSSQPITMGDILYSTLTGYVYGFDGQIFDPSTNSVINQLPVNVVAGGVPANENTPLALDDNLGLAWVVVQTVDSPTQQMTIEAFDLSTNALLGSIAIPNVVGTPVKLIRWGSNGLAFLTSGSNSPQQGDGVYIISGAFVTTPSVQARAVSRFRH